MAFAVVPISASYSSSCENCQLRPNSDGEESILMCNCGDGQGGAPETRLNLDRCLMNDRGVIRPRADGQVSHSCYLFQLQGTEFIGSCSV
ncbi:hypothetical protein FQN54_001690 [Arachnomyces sp. PD_36]|nr:hypothetical protein FQN54_001690 [Arachnomyces sp. PD_36]